jgi:Spy/CpxP family protein refolding chaperone
MSLKNKLFTGLTVAGAAFAFSTFTMAQETSKPDSDNTQKREWRKGKRDGFGGKGFHRGGGGLRGLRDLNLTDAQKEQIRTIMEANRPNQNSFEEMKALRDATRDGTLTDAQKDQLKSLREARRAQSENVRAQVLAILTPEQRQQLEAKKAEMQQRREERRQERRERRQQTPQTGDQDN